MRLLWRMEANLDRPNPRNTSYLYFDLAMIPTAEARMIKYHCTTELGYGDKLLLSVVRHRESRLRPLARLPAWQYGVVIPDVESKSGEGAGAPCIAGRQQSA